MSITLSSLSHKHTWSAYSTPFGDAAKRQRIEKSTSVSLACLSPHLSVEASGQTSRLKNCSRLLVLFLSKAFKVCIKVFEVPPLRCVRSHNRACALGSTQSLVLADSSTSSRPTTHDTEPDFNRGV